MYSEYVSVAYVLQRAMGMRHITRILIPVASLEVPYFSTLIHKWHDVWKRKVVEHEMCVLIFASLLSKICVLFIPKTIQRGVIKNVHWSSCKLSDTLVGF